jgi:fatty acid CoA ligase FadD36
MDLLAGLLGAAGTASDDPHAITIGSNGVSRAELIARADRLAGELVGARAVAVRATSDLDTVTAIVAALRARVPVVPIAHDAGGAERNHILRDSGADLICGSDDWDDVSLPRVPVDAAGGSGSLPVDDGDRPALIMYTSGTTGAPKGVLIPERAIVACLDGLADAWQWTATDHLVHGLPLFHVHGLVLGVLGAFRHGSALTHTGRPTPEAYAAAAGRGGSLFFGVPTVWSRVTADPASAAALRSARAIVSGSAPLPVSVFDRVRDLTGVTPLERYGMTETLITVSTRFDGERRPGWVGLPIAGVETRVRDDDGSLITPDGTSIGTLEVRGATLGDGYLGRPDATAASLTDDGWFITGDSAVIDADGMHRIVGRTSVDIIKCGGFKVGAGEVEAAVAEVGGIREVAVIGVPDDDLGESIVAVVVTDGPVASAAIIDHVASTLSVHKRPRRVVVVDELPRNALGKVQKRELLARVTAQGRREGE